MLHAKQTFHKEQWLMAKHKLFQMKKSLLLLVTIEILLSFTVYAHASRYAYVDEKGVCHYTNEPGPGRYKLRKKYRGEGAGEKGVKVDGSREVIDGCESDKECRNALNLGKTYLNLNRNDEAIDAFRQAVKIKPDNALAWIWLGKTYIILNRNAEAVDAYRQAVKIIPYVAEAWSMLGELFIRLNRKAEAVDAFRQAVKINPNYSEAWGWLGWIYLHLNRKAEAIDAYRQVVKIQPVDAFAWRKLGLVYLDLNRNAEAVEAHRQVVKINPHNTDAVYSLGVACYKLGDKSAALDVVKVLRPQNSELADELFDLIIPPSQIGAVEQREMEQKALEKVRRWGASEIRRMIKIN